MTVLEMIYTEKYVVALIKSNTAESWDSLALWFDFEPQMLPCQETEVQPVRSDSAGNQLKKTLLLAGFVWSVSSCHA